MNRVDWLRDIRGFDYYDRLSNMIKEWAELGMVLPVRSVTTSFPVADVRVEQGRSQKGKPIEVRDDPKFHVTEDVENLFVDVAQATALTSPPRKTAPPPKRSYRQGEI